MEEERLQKIEEHKDYLKNNQIIIILVLIAIIIVVSLVFIRQILYVKSINTDLQNKNTDLENKIMSLDKQIQSEKDTYENILKEQTQKDIDERNNIVSSKMTGWNTYYDAKNNYTIKYPNNWISMKDTSDWIVYFLNENVGAPLEMSSNGIFVVVSANVNSDNLTLSDWISREKISKGTEILSSENININGIEAIQRIKDATQVEDTSGLYSIHTYFLKDNTIYSIVGMSSDKEGLNKNIEEYKYMVNSFDFVK
ncbi:MAG: hypothetical protein PHZ07_01880 [Patescibacteria group bacterium]|nr:hypothetical protein [Patescibacteria group bacterium]MDD4304065.1 hypothetical protein [Patescibacteria group bacterium]MDD4694942.1 hypothetical protein [Patescibacteria group bacterium]